MNEEEIQYKQLDVKIFESSKKFVKFSEEYNNYQEFFNCPGSGPEYRNNVRIDYYPMVDTNYTVSMLFESIIEKF